MSVSEGDLFTNHTSQAHPSVSRPNGNLVA